MIFNNPDFNNIVTPYTNEITNLVRQRFDLDLPEGRYKVTYSESYNVRGFKEKGESY